MRDDVRQLLALATGEDEAALRRALLEYVGDSNESRAAMAHAEASAPDAVAAFRALADQQPGFLGVAP